MSKKDLKLYLYLAMASALIALSVIFMLWSIAYMESAMVATSLLSALAGFTFLSGGLYVLRLSAHVYALEKEEH